MSKSKSIIIILCVTFLFYTPLLYSLEVATHEAINVRIAGGSFDGFSTDSYLKNNLGFNNGINERVGNRRIWEWLRDGGRYEDIPAWYLIYLRSVNHFHNPITDRGFSGWFFGKLLSGESSRDWFQKSLGTQSPGGHYSWHDVRDYFYKGLTLPNKPEREKYFGETFRGLGQLMHLVQDLSVPAHTRDDPHIVGYEIWVRDNIDPSALSLFSFDGSILKIPTSGLAIANIFDSNQYNGTNPDLTAGNDVGLSEYTNANFFSEDTINSISFPYPRIENDATVVTKPYKGPAGTYDRQYFLKDKKGETNAGKGYLLSAVDYNDYWRRNNPGSTIDLPVIPVLDENVYRDYASLLIPRAVGYSAGLLQYFFRGKLQVTSLPIFYKNGIYIVRVKIKNITPTEETMKNGWFTLSYHYTPTEGAADGSEDKYGQTSVCSSEQPCEQLKYQDEKSFDFILPALIPKETYDSVKFTLAFKGTLENKDGTSREDGAVIGKYFTPGEIKFYEEWDNGLSGNHSWAHLDFGTAQAYPGHGITSNTIEGDTLIKENIRYAGFTNPSANGSFVGIDPYYPGYHDNLPILITANTSLQFKIDKMSMNYIPSSPTGKTALYQGLWLFFNNGLVLQLSRDGQFVDYSPTTAMWTFELGLIFVDNIYKMFLDAGITIPPGDLYLEKIDFIQQLFELADPSTVDYRQRMEVDFIRIIEEKQQEEIQ